MFNDIWVVFQYIGAIWVAVQLLSLLKEIKTIFNSNPDVSKYYGIGSWALVTGSTDGIGKGFCQQLTIQGFNICLVARNKTKAEELVESLKLLNNKCHFKIILADFLDCVTNDKFFDQICQQIKDLDVSVLVNNVGLATFKTFKDTEIKEIKEMITVNCYPTVILTKKLIPQLLKRTQKSAIINVSSLSALFPFPYYSIYAATKIFDDNFSKAIALQFQEKIDILSLQPAYVSTYMTGFSKGNGAINIDECAQGCLQRLRLNTSTSGHWYHRVQKILYLSIPYDIMRVLVNIAIPYESQRVNELQNKLK